MGSQSWFRYLWPNPRAHTNHDSSPVMAVLAFEVAALMSKLVHLCQSLTDKQLIRLRQDITNSVGIAKLVSQDDDHIGSLVCAEMMENMSHIARAVARLGTNCNQPALKNFQHIFNHLLNTGLDPNGWAFSWNKMERKTKKMHKFISLNANLYQEMEILTDLEQTLKRMKTNNDAEGVHLVDFEKQVAWKKQEVKRFKDVSLWNKTHDEIVLLLARSLFTLYARIKHVFAIDQPLQAGGGGGIPDSGVFNSDNNHRNPSLSMLLQSSDNHRSQNDFSRFSSGPLMKSSTTRSGHTSRTVNTSNFYSGPLQSSTTKSGRESGTNNRGAVSFFSGPLGKQSTKSGPLSGTSKVIQRLWQRHANPSGVERGKNLHTKRHGLAAAGGTGSVNTVQNEVHSGILGRDNTDAVAYSGDVRFAKVSMFSPKRRLLNAPSDTLGGAALALHYANVIIVIEKLAASPHLMGHDARDDLYSMLPARVRATLRERLKPHAKSLSASVCDTGLAVEWSEAMACILEWLAPLAHNMIRWQTERSFEQHKLVSRTHVLLVETLYFANQEKTEGVITELLVGLNYVWRYGREVNAKESSKIFGDTSVVGY